MVGATIEFGSGGHFDPVIQEKVDVRMDVVAPGNRINGRPERGAERTFRYTVDGRQTTSLDAVREQLARYRSYDPTIHLIVDPRDGVVLQEVVTLLDMGRDLDYERIQIRGRFGR